MSETEAERLNGQMCVVCVKKLTRRIGKKSQMLCFF